MPQASSRETPCLKEARGTPNFPEILAPMATSAQNLAGLTNLLQHLVGLSPAIFGVIGLLRCSETTHIHRRRGRGRPVRRNVCWFWVQLGGHCRGERCISTHMRE